MNCIIWVIDWDDIELYPKHKQEEIMKCKHDWWIGETVVGSPVSSCNLCGVPRELIG